ncbi:MAG TPA: molybdopterin molybdotransferase MoeA [Tessaracoccus flavescens]|uniref:Molybdopterin molybdenumtransferase n=1 Tax=Tessaracoccus flavescens TaxID=399497 RepID=A0A921JR81_9ACTN|nr:molybdopterin molybdotransferase MoeA [Tessaracoccus flavescens]
MLTIEQHLERVLALVGQLPAEQTPIGDGVGRVLADGLAARLAVPPFDNSSMDGFAVRSADVRQGARLRIVGDIPAGALSVPTVGEGEAARIMTGAPFPPGADAVAQVEITDQPMGAVALPESVQILESVAPGQFIRRAGDDVAVGDVVLPAGLRWTPAAGASAASMGYAEVPLIRRPRVAIVATGAELVAAGQPLGFGQIPDSNSVLLAGLCRGWGADVALSQVVDDDPDSFVAALSQATAADLVLTTGGVSVGAFEVVRLVTEGTVEFVQVAMQPGKPQAAGTLRTEDGRRVPMIGLPGNPVSVCVSAWAFVRPVLAKLGGWSGEWPSEQLPVAAGWSGPSGRRQFIPVVIGPDGVAPSHRLGSGSHLIASLAVADGFAVVPEEVTRVEVGDTVAVHRF